MNTLPIILNHLISALQAIQKDLAIKRMELSKSASEERNEHAEPQN
jgi:hypothetical protein